MSKEVNTKLCPKIINLSTTNKFWRPIRETLDKLTTKSPDEVKSWFVTETLLSAYSQVHIGCVAPEIIPFLADSKVVSAEFFHSMLIYVCLNKYMTLRFKTISLGIESKSTAEEAFVCYMQAHLAFETYRKVIEKMFHYIQHHWVDLSEANLAFEKKFFRLRHYLFPFGWS